MTEPEIKFCQHVETSPDVWACAVCGHVARTNAQPGNRPCGVKAPGLFKKAQNFARAQVTAALDLYTKVSKEEATERRAICKSNKCGKYDGTNHTCLDCGCPLKYKPEMRSWDCRLGFWPSLKGQPKPRVGFVYPMWHKLGGVERHTYTLIQNCPEIKWSGLVGMNQQIVDTHALADLRKHIPATKQDGLANLKLNSDILIVWGFDNPIDWLKDFKGKVVAVSHNQDGFETLQVNQLLKYSKHHVAVSQAAVVAYPEHLRDKVTVIHNGISFDRLSSSGTKEECKIALGIDPKETVIGFVGRLSMEKNPLATARVAGKLNATALYIGNNSNTAVADDYIKQARALANNKLIWVDDASHDRMGNYYRAMDSIVVTSLWDGGPLVAGEAWFCGIPVVATPVGWFPELEKQHGPLTWQVPLNASDGKLVAAVEASLKPDDRVAKARDVVMNYLSSASFSQQWSNFLQEVMRT